MERLIWGKPLNILTQYISIDIGLKISYKFTKFVHNLVHNFIQSQPM
jgi:hypothetical protein